MQPKHPLSITICSVWDDSNDEEIDCTPDEFMSRPEELIKRWKVFCIFN